MRVKNSRKRLQAKIRKLLNNPSIIINGERGQYWLHTEEEGRLTSSFKSLSKLFQYVSSTNLQG